MMMAMVMSQRSHTGHDTRAVEIGLSIGFWGSCLWKLRSSKTSALPADSGRGGRQEFFAAPLMLVSAIPKAEDDAGDDAEIILKLHRRGGVGKRSTQIIGADSHGKRPADGAFDPAT